MIVLTHIILATITLILTTLVLIAPSAIKLRFSYFFAAGTLASGICLVFVDPSQFSHVCVTGIVFFTIVGFLLHFAKQRLAKETIKP